MTFQQKLREILEATTTTDEKHAAIVALIDDFIGKPMPLHPRDQYIYERGKGHNEIKEELRDRLNRKPS